jgi:hypothetical protein
MAQCVHTVPFQYKLSAAALELTFVLTSMKRHGIIRLFPKGNLQGNKETLASGERPRIGIPKGEQVCQ